MSRLDETQAFVPEPTWAYSALAKPLPENVDVLNRTITKVPPVGGVVGTVLAPMNTGGAPTVFNVQTSGNSKILLHQTAIEVELVFHDGIGATMVQAVPVWDVWATLVNTISLSVNSQATPIFTSAQGLFTESHEAYMLTYFSNQQLERLPWLFTPCISGKYAQLYETGTANTGLHGPGNETYLDRASRWFAAEPGLGAMVGTENRRFKLVIPLRDALGIRLPDCSPNNLRSMQLSIQWSDDRTEKPFCRFRYLGVAPLPAVQVNPACSVSVVSINLLVASNVMSGSETASSVQDKMAEKMDILGFLAPQPMRLNPSTDMIFGSVANMQHVFIMQSAFQKSNGIATPNKIENSDCLQLVPFNAYRSAVPQIIASIDSTTIVNPPQGVSIAYGSIAQFPTPPINLSGGTLGIPMDEAKYQYDMVIDRVSRRDLVACVDKRDMQRTMFFIALKPFSSESLTLTRVAKDLLVRMTSLSGVPAGGYAGDDGRIVVIAFRAVVYGLAVDGQVFPLQ